MKIPLTTFRKILEDHGFLALTNEPYEACHKALKAAEKKDLRIQDFIGRWCELYREKYPPNYPDITGKEAKAAGDIVKALGLEAAVERAEKYLQMDTPWFVTKGHDLATLLGNLNVVKNGTVITRKKAEALGAHSSTMDAAARAIAQRRARNAGETNDPEA